MMNRERVRVRSRAALSALVALLVAVGLAVWPDQTWAQVTCPTASTADSDGDGFTDAQECDGITLVNGTLFPGVLTSVNGVSVPRADRLDPNSKDLFVIYKPASSGSLLSGATAIGGGLPNPFGNLTFYSINFTGLSALGVTVHQLADGVAAADRTVSNAATQKAVRVAESLDTTGTILGNCQWGTPLGLDGCVVYTQRAKDFIDSTCDSAGDTTTDRTQVFLAYATYLVLHETGHSLGGLTTDYNSRFGGYHYKAGSGVVMEQYATYSTRGNRCTWYISSGWNETVDPTGVTLGGP